MPVRFNPHAAKRLRVGETFRKAVIDRFQQNGSSDVNIAALQRPFGGRDHPTIVGAGGPQPSMARAFA
jgi:hypothetical protein